MPFFGTGSADIVAVTLGNNGTTVDKVNTTERGTATDRELGGSDGIVGWTRWAGGTLAGSSSVTIPANGGGGFVYGVPVTNLPTSGTGMYNMVGATAVVVTDGSLAPGTVSSASLSVDFAARKVGFQAAMTIGGQNYTAETNGGIAARAFTLTSSGLFSSAGNWTVTGNGCSATANCAGRVAGFLAGPGASHAGLGLFFNPAPGSSLTASTAIGFKAGGGP